MIGVLGGSAALLLAGSMVLEGGMKPGSFFLFYAAIFSLYEPVRKLARTVNRLQLASAGATRIFELMDHEPDIADRPGAVELPRVDGEVRLEGVSFAYPGREAALVDVDLAIPAGATVAIVGPSGAGKSTLVRLIPRLLDPDRGRVLLDGRDIREVTLASLRSQIALVPQETILFNDTIEANIAFARPDAGREDVLAAARSARVDEFAERLEEGYATLIGEGGRGLSGGQRQRLALARAMLRDPRIVILDEATSALDPESEELVRDGLDRFLAGRTAFIVVHHPRTMARADLVVVLEDARVQCVGTPEECRAESPIYRSFLEHGTLPERGDTP
jgi:ABC-type multidrug transport system fused ATPase/permease subunit